jgi:hypothetical protein
MVSVQRDYRLEPNNAVVAGGRRGKDDRKQPASAPLQKWIKKHVMQSETSRDCRFFIGDSNTTGAETKIGRAARW